MASGQYERLIAAGIGVDVVASAEIQKEWGALPQAQCWLPLEQFVGGRARAKVREALRLACLVSGAQRGSRTYQHKLTLDRPWLARQELRGWRWLSRVRDPERIAAAIERMLPIPAWLRTLPLGFYDLLILPTLMHEDNTQNDVMKAAKAKGVPVLAVPASFDTLLSKGCWLVRPDRLAVWGLDSKTDAETEHGFSPETIAIAGPPWFWPYTTMSKRQGDLVVYAGTSVAYSADEADHVAAIQTWLQRPSDPALRYRLHPRRGTGWSLQQRDAVNTADEVSRACLLVTAFSTMIIEAALCGRPSAIIAFGRSTDGRFGLKEHTEYAHMARVLSKPGVFVCRDLGMLRSAVQVFSRQPHPDPEMRSWALRVAAVSEDPRAQMVRAVRWAARR